MHDQLVGELGITVHGVEVEHSTRLPYSQEDKADDQALKDAQARKKRERARLIGNSDNEDQDEEEDEERDDGDELDDNDQLELQTMD